MKVLAKLLAISFVFLLLSNHGIGLNASLEHNNSDSDFSSLLNNARIENKDGITLLYIAGTHYEMGYQHGFLLKDQIEENMRAYMEFAKGLTTYETLLDMWNESVSFIPDCYIQEMQGIADGANISFNRIAALYMLIPFIDMKCFTFAAWSNATINGKLYHIRSLDFPLLIKDPVTGTYLQDNSVLIIRNPENGLKSINPSIAGSMNFYQGINERNISIGLQVCWSEDQTLEGSPIKFNILKVLDTAETIDGAIDILTTNSTLGWNFIVSDGDTNEAYIVEVTANNTYVGTDSDPVESIAPFWSIEDVVRRTNFFIDPTLASIQRSFYDPTGVTGLLGLFTGEPFFPLWRKYRSMSIEIEENWSELDLEMSMSLLRKVYTGKTDFFMLVFLSLGKNSILTDFHQWGVCTETDEFVVSFADKRNYAHENTLHYFNINELFNS
ncbi:MAG: hypothetical protein KGY50_02085 [Candidatus Thermoplasmatota archaeon]|nr:hypothetical protein [Candidatus Thermoplasmatota archaeon]